MKSLERLLQRPQLFPLELTLSSGEKHILPHPDHAEIDKASHELIVYDDDRNFRMVIDPAHVVSASPFRKKI